MMMMVMMTCDWIHLLGWLLVFPSLLPNLKLHMRPQTYSVTKSELATTRVCSKETKVVEWDACRAKISVWNSCLETVSWHGPNWYNWPQMRLFQIKDLTRSCKWLLLNCKMDVNIFVSLSTSFGVIALCLFDCNPADYCFFVEQCGNSFVSTTCVYDSRNDYI